MIAHSPACQTHIFPFLVYLLSELVNSGLTSHQQRGQPETGPRFKVSSENCDFSLFKMTFSINLLGWLALKLVVHLGSVIICNRVQLVRFIHLSIFQILLRNIVKKKEPIMVFPFAFTSSAGILSLLIDFHLFKALQQFQLPHEESDKVLPLGACCIFEADLVI